MDEPHTPLVNQHETPAPAPPPADGTRSHRSALLIVFLVVFIDLFGFGIVLPLLPRYGEEFLAGASARQHGIILGLLMASFSAMQFVFAPIWGRISDRVGRRPILLLGLVSSVVFYVLFGFASMLGREESRQLGLILLFVSRLGAGIAGATISTAQAVIADSTTPERRSRGMALIGAAFGIGFFFGPLLGFGILDVLPNSPGGPGFLAAGLSFVALLLGLALLPETLRPGSPHARRHWLDPRGLRSALEAPRVGTLILIFFLITLAFANFEPTLALITTVKALGLSNKKNFLIFAYVGLVLALSQGVLYRRLARRVREITFMWIGTLLMVIGLAGVGVVAVLAQQVAPDFGPWRDFLAVFAAAPGDPLPAAGVPWFGLYLVSPQRATALLVILLLVLAVAVTGFGFVLPSIQSLVSRLSDPAKQGEVLGINQSANALSRILGPFFGMLLYFATPGHVLPYVFGGAVLLVGLVLTLRLRLK